MTSETNLQFAPTGPMMNPNVNAGSTLPGQSNLLSGSFSSMSQPSSANQPPSSGSILQQLFPLKVLNVPADLSEREAKLIFALVHDDVASVELKDQVITANFKTLNTCITTGKLLENKPIFGSNLPQVNVEYDANVPLAATTGAFNNMRLSNSGISPPSSHPVPLAAQLLSGSQSSQGVKSALVHSTHSRSASQLETKDPDFSLVTHFQAQRLQQMPTLPPDLLI